MLVVLVVLALFSVWQASGFVQFSARARSIRNDEQSARVEAEALGKHLTALEKGLDRPEAAAKLNEIGFLNSLIARRELSWTKMFATLEQMVPEKVHLVKIGRASCRERMSISVLAAVSKIIMIHTYS